MIFEEKNVKDLVVLEMLDQRLDANVAGGLKNRLKKLVDNCESSVIINLSKVNFIDSSGLGAIIAGVRQLPAEREMAICETSETVDSLFRLTRMDKVFRIFDSESAAVSALTSEKE